jgi:hypothetical protein
MYHDRRWNSSKDVSLLDYEDFCHLKETVHPFCNRSDKAEVVFTRVCQGNPFIDAVTLTVEKRPDMAEGVFTRVCRLGGTFINAVT